MKKQISIFLETLLSIARVIWLSKFSCRLPKTTYQTNRCLMFGNGPSLDGDLAQCAHYQSVGDIWCVNQFATSHLYEMVKPTHYVIADPSYWAINLSVRLENFREDLLSALERKTVWPLSLYIPFPAKEYMEKRITNHNVSLIYYNFVPVMGYKKVVNFFYDHNMGMPWAQNVLVAALYLALNRGYKEIYVLGADHSWHETIELDEYNRVCQRDRHFYDKGAKRVPFTMGGDEGATFTMAEIFTALAKMFDGYWKIKHYSSRLGAQIFNASSITYIDAFPRIKPNEIYRPQNAYPLNHER